MVADFAAAESAYIRMMTSAGYSVTQEDHNHHRLLELQSEVYGTVDHDLEFEEGRYESDFFGADRSIIGRVDRTPTLANNYPGKDNIESGKKVWIYPKKALISRSSPVSAGPSSSAEGDSTPPFDDHKDSPLHTRQAGPALLHITLNICDQPLPKTANPNGAPAPLQLYISTDSDNKSPDNDKNNYEVPITYGYGAISINVTSDVYLSVVVPEKSKQFEGKYSYELTGSTDNPYTTYVDDATMVLVDSDNGAALLSSEDATDTSMYGVFVHPQDDRTILGLSRSFCGLSNWARIKGNINDLSTGDVDTGLMLLGGSETKQQFYVKNLNGSSAYYGIMALNGTSTGSKLGAGNVGGGGKLWKPMNFTTKGSGNCAVIYNLTFCSDVAYAVPSNNTKYNQTELSNLYDNDAKDKYQNFSKSLNLALRCHYP
ncbi:calcium influx-promoting protein ehs1 [Physcia stellaris]|nr:calcium influx-promoting protein ehs1 [Physcia stellaris]